MNKIVLLMALFCCSIFYASSQVSFNAKAGGNVSKVTGGTDAKFGYQFSVGADYYFTKEWGVQSAIVLVSKGAKDKVKNIDAIGPNGEDINFLQIKYNMNAVYLELPVMLAYKMSMTDDIKFVFNGGGYVACGVGGNYTTKWKMLDRTIKDKEGTFDDDIRRFDTGLAAGFTIEVSNKYTVGLTGSWGLRSISGGDSGKNQSYGLNVGYKF